MLPFWHHSPIRTFIFVTKGSDSGRSMHINTQILNCLMLYQTLFRHYRIQNDTLSSSLCSWHLLCSIQSILTSLIGPGQNSEFENSSFEGKLAWWIRKYVISVLALKKKEVLTSHFYKCLWAEILGMTFFFFVLLIFIIIFSCKS